MQHFYPFVPSEVEDVARGFAEDEVGAGTTRSEFVVAASVRI